MDLKEAMFYEDAGQGRVRCRLCWQHCQIATGHRGLCGVRENRGGRLVSLVYGRPASRAVDPMEKKPLYHFLPGTGVYSFGTRGCNLRCLYCQNCSISQVAADEPIIDPVVAPATIVSQAQATGCDGIAYTYSEPTIFFEYAYDIAVLARRQKLRNVFVTNGYIGPEALRFIAPYLDAANIDLKFFRDDLYRKICGARLQPVLDMIRLYHELGVWIEVTTLVVPGYNDDTAQLSGIAEFIAGLDPQIPWHVSAFYPMYRLTDAVPTPVATLKTARTLGRKAGLEHIYLGNVGEGADTRCGQCGGLVIARAGMRVELNRLDHGRCPNCGAAVKGVWG